MNTKNRIRLVLRNSSGAELDAVWINLNATLGEEPENFPGQCLNAQVRQWTFCVGDRLCIEEDET